MKKYLFLLLCVFVTLFSCKDDENDTPVILSSLGSHPVSALAIDNSGALWIGTDTGLFKSVKTGFELIDIKKDAPVTALGFDETSNTLWVGTLSGLSKLSLKGNGTSSQGISPDSLCNDTVNYVYVDPNSVNWFGTNLGITRNVSNLWQKEKFKKNSSGTITPADFEKIGINSIASWEGNYFFATKGRKLYRAYNWVEAVDAFSGASMWDYGYNGYAISDTMYAVFIDSKGQQWFGGKEGLQVHIGHIPTSENTSFYDELVNPIVHCIAEAPDGKIWAGTENGISIYDGNNWTPFSGNLPDGFITAIAFEKTGKTWIGTKKGLVSSD
jgi:ligand-binding sensor domain-containing protein